jgi:hypothetical protein
MSSILSSVGAWTFSTMILYQRPLCIMYDNLSLTNSTLLTADMILLCTKKPVTNSWFSFPFPLRNMYLPAHSVPPPSYLTLCTPTKCNLYFEISSPNALSEPALYMLLTFHLVSIFFRVGRLSKESIQVQGLFWMFVTILFLWWAVVSPTPNPQAGDHPMPAVRNCLLNTFLPLLPEDVPCCGDKGPT